MKTLKGEKMKKYLICFLSVFILTSFFGCTKINLDKSKESTTMDNEIVKEMNSIALKRVSEGISNF